jgi:18S rRNA (adenine1779-N6/adenine1780-N6)-dimethyltransferase
MVEDDMDFKDRIEQILTDSGFSDARAAKMDVDDLLK